MIGNDGRSVDRAFQDMIRHMSFVSKYDSFYGGKWYGLTVSVSLYMLVGTKKNFMCAVEVGVGNGNSKKQLGGQCSIPGKKWWGGLDQSDDNGCGKKFKICFDGRGKF